jgi:hypothetical protein
MEGSHLVDLSPFVFYVKKIGCNGRHTQAIIVILLSRLCAHYAHHTPRSLPSTIFPVLRYMFLLPSPAHSFIHS